MGRKASNEHHEFLSGFLLILSMAAERNSEELLTCFLFVVTGCPVTLCRALKKKKKKTSTKEAEFVFKCRLQSITWQQRFPLLRGSQVCDQGSGREALGSSELELWDGNYA